jgi:hypothetical protein
MHNEITSFQELNEPCACDGADAPEAGSPDTLPSRRHVMKLAARLAGGFGAFAFLGKVTTRDAAAACNSRGAGFICIRGQKYYCQVREYNTQTGCACYSWSGCSPVNRACRCTGGCYNCLY